MEVKYLLKERFNYYKKIARNIFLKLFWYRWSFVSRSIIRNLGKKIPDNEYSTHAYITGKTGSGKSSFVEQWVYYQRNKSRHTRDRSIIVLDPHGDMVEKIRKFDLAKRFFDSHIYIDPTLSKGHTPTINPLECWSKNGLDIEVQANQILRALEEMIPDAKLSNFMRAILKPCLYILLTKNTSNLQDLQEFLSQEDGKRVEAGKKSEIQAYARLFSNEWSHPMYKRTKQSVITKIQSLLNSQVFYHMTIGESTINLEREIRKGKIILFNLSKGKMGEEVSETLGKFLIAQIKSIALRRAGLPGKLRKPIYLIIDEADTFIGGDSLNVILKETRKYGLHLILITQNLVSGRQQESLKRNLINNTNVKVIGANGLQTLKALSAETSIELKLLQKLGFHQFRIRYGTNRRKLIKTHDVLRGRSPLLLKRGEVISQTNKMVHYTGYYKPIVTKSLSPDRIEEFPLNRQDKMYKEHYPKPKF